MQVRSLAKPFSGIIEGAADQILVLREGRLVERGTHTALLAADGEYRQLVRAYGGTQ